MLNEDQLKLKQIQRRMISQMSSMESFQIYLANLSRTSESSPALRLAAEATSALVSLMTLQAAVSQSEMDRLYWTNDLAPLRSWREHWRIAYENLNDQMYLPPLDELDSEPCDCDD